MKKSSGYVIGTADAIIKGNLDPDFSALITNTLEVNVIDNIDNFSILSMQQYDEESFSNDQILVSNEDGVIVVVAKYLGPEFNYAGTFDFSLQIGSDGHPSFTAAGGRSLDCMGLINLLNHQKKKPGRSPKKVPPKKVPKKTSADISKFATNKKSPKKPQKPKPVAAEVGLKKEYTRITGKSANRGRGISKEYTSWKDRTIKAYKGNAIWKGKLTSAFQEYLTKMSGK